MKAIASAVGPALHADARWEGVASDSFIGSTLVNFYSKLKASMEAKAVCGGLVERDVVAWSAMLSAYVEQGQVEREEVSANRIYSARVEGQMQGVQRTTNAIVAGGGLVGFGATHGLTKVGLSVTLLNATSDPGGLSTSFCTSQGLPVEVGIKGF
ncbi:hypothetical protein L7F22_038249 [Adiantum nelumboides]|nr:hypothetical protein [Adiantum nelumboides]